MWGEEGLGVAWGFLLLRLAALVSVFVMDNSVFGVDNGRVFGGRRSGDRMRVTYDIVLKDRTSSLI